MGDTGSPRCKGYTGSPNHNLGAMDPLALVSIEPCSHFIIIMPSKLAERPFFIPRTIFFKNTSIDFPSKIECIQHNVSAYFFVDLYL